MKGITHRDIKSSNIMVTTQGQAESRQIKIKDFGLAKQGGQARLTKTGTPACISPERIQGMDAYHRCAQRSLV